MPDPRMRAAGLTAAILAFGSPLAAQPAPAAEPPVAGGETAPTPPRDGFDLQQVLREGEAPLTADQAATRAVQTSPSVQAADAARERAREAASEVFVAVYPRLDLEARYTRLSEVESGLVDNDAPPAMTGVPALDVFLDGLQDFADPPPDRFLLQATLTYPLSDLFFKILPSYRASGQAADAEAFNVAVEQRSVALSAREAFYEYARAKASLAVARAALAQSEAQRRDVASLVDAGTLARVELMRADAVVASARVAIARAEGAMAVAATALRTLLHAEGEREFAIVEDFTQPLPPLAEGREALIRRAFANRSEVKALRKLARVHETNADVHAADKLPKLTIGGSAEYAKPNPRAVGDIDWQESWAAFASLSWSPSDLAGGSARQGQARADLARTRAELRAIEDALRLEVTRAYEDYKAAHAAMEASQTGIAAAEESYRVRREQFRAGSAVATEVIDAEFELRRARLELVNAAIDLRIARARLDRALER